MDALDRLGTDLPERLAVLGFTEADAADAVAAARRALGDPEAVATLTSVVGRLQERIGAFLDDGAGRWAAPFDHADPDESDADGADSDGTTPDAAAQRGVLALLALVATADDVRDWHRTCGIDASATHDTLADLGRHVAQHRRVFGRLGLEAPHRLLPHWQGSLHQLGRLQLDLQRVRTGGRRGASLPEPLRSQPWLLSVHIPDTGPLRSRDVDASLARAVPFFTTHLGAETAYARCTSWLLDPHLATVLPPESHVVRFQRRFTPFGEPSVGDDDAVYFTFGRRGLSDLRDLPRDTVLRRAVLDRIEAGDHWYLVQGWTALPRPG
ncbi:acyltransferase domain-containing protein [Thalassiella azotivora]